MKTIGLLGGMSWESTATYYQLINQGIKQALGGSHSAKIAMYSVDFQEIETLQHRGDWDATAEILIDGAKRLEAAGAECLVICTNTMHKVAHAIQDAISIPILHIADATGIKLVDDSVTTVGLLGTSFTMEQAFYKDHIAKNFGLNVTVPEEDDRAIVHRVIYEELCNGKIQPESKAEYLRIINALAKQGAEAVILGCTEIGLLVNQKDTSVTLIDTVSVHAQRAVDFALSKD